MGGRSGVEGEGYCCRRLSDRGYHCIDNLMEVVVSFQFELKSARSIRLRFHDFWWRLTFASRLINHGNDVIVEHHQS